MSEIRLLTYNIRALRDDADAVSAVIRALSPDVVCVQEAPRFMRWRSKRAAVARKAGLVVATADRPAGLMLMTSLRATVVSTNFVLLSKRPNLHQRGVCTAVLELGGVRWNIASVHLSLSEEERQIHLPELWSAVGGAGPLVVAGDINEEPGGPGWTELGTRLVDAWQATRPGKGLTCSGSPPRKRSAAVVGDRGVDGVECRVADAVPGGTVASDRLPLLAVLRAQGPG